MTHDASTSTSTDPIFSFLIELRSLWASSWQGCAIFLASHLPPVQQERIEAMACLSSGKAQCKFNSATTAIE
jgi:hypothetical protein